MRRALPLLALCFSLLSCGDRRDSGREAAAMDPIAEGYVKLALAMSRHDSDYVDAYYGPPEWKEAAERDSLPLEAIAARAESLGAALHRGPHPEGDGPAAERHRYLETQLGALAARVRMLRGERVSFDAESKALYDAVAPRRADAHFAPALARLDSLLPGRGTLQQRYDAFRRAYVIPPARVDTVFRAAIAESRRRTLQHVTLPDSESFTLEYVRGKPWSGYNWYQGGSKSLIQINTDLPIHIERALDLGCHEGYPGHHVYNALLEQALVHGRGWTEFTLFPLFSPLALIAEGTAVVAPGIVFPGAERERFEKEVLFPLAGIDTALYARYDAVRRAMEGLNGAAIEAARRYLDGEISGEQMIEWSMAHELRTRARAEQGRRFADRYRSYVINYGHGRELVTEWLARNGGDESNPERRWELYRGLLASPRLPADLRADRP